MVPPLLLSEKPSVTELTLEETKKAIIFAETYLNAPKFIFTWDDGSFV